jgi:hypothetical protein
MRGSSPRMTQRMLRRLAQLRFTFQTATRLRSRAAARGELLVCLPFVRGSGAPKGACVTSRGVSPGSPEDRGTRQRLFGAPPAASSSTPGPFFRHRRELWLAIQAGFRPPFACPVQPLKAAPRSGHGRLPEAPRVRACEARPRAPHRPVRVTPPRPALALSHFRIASRSAPSLDRTGSG